MSCPYSDSSELFSTYGLNWPLIEVHVLQWTLPSSLTFPSPESLERVPWSSMWPLLWIGLDFGQLLPSLT